MSQPLEVVFRIEDAEFRVVQLSGFGTAWTPERVALACRYEFSNTVEVDGTDAAHPAYWRGHDDSCALGCSLVAELCASPKGDAGVSMQPWQAAREAIIALRTERDALKAQLQAQPKPQP